MSKRFHTKKPRLTEHRILEYIPNKYMIEIQTNQDEYMRIKTTPALEDKIIEDIERLFRVKTETFTSNDSCIIEIKPPIYDVIVTPNLEDFPMHDEWILQVVKNSPYSKLETIATLKYDKEHPYNLDVAEHLMNYMNFNAPELESMTYEEIYTI